MKLGIILNTADTETAWNALRLANEAIAAGNDVSIFLLGKGVQISNLEGVGNEIFDVPGLLGEFLANRGELSACGTCLQLHPQEIGICSVSTMAQLVAIIDRSDKVITFG